MRVQTPHERLGETIRSHHDQPTEAPTSRNLGMEKRRKIGSPPEPDAQTRNHESGTRGSHNWTPRTQRDHCSDSTELLVARHASMDHGVRPGMRYVPTKQDHHPSHSPPNVQNPH